MNSIPLQASIGGLAANVSDPTITVLGALDVPTGVLLVDVARNTPAGEPEHRAKGCAFVTNNGSAEDFDLLFTEDAMRQAISDYYAFAGRGLLVLDRGVERFNPANMIEPDGLDERGRKYRIKPDANNGQLAVIVLCWFALQQSGFARQLAAFDEYAADLSITTVGIGSTTSSGRRVAGYAMGGQLALGPDGWPV